MTVDDYRGRGGQGCQHLAGAEGDPAKARREAGAGEDGEEGRCPEGRGEVEEAVAMADEVETEKAKKKDEPRDVEHKRERPEGDDKQERRPTS